jgi:hypothetical protein
VHVDIEHVAVGTPIAAEVHQDMPMLRGRGLERRGKVGRRLLRRGIDIGQRVDRRSGAEHQRRSEQGAQNFRVFHTNTMAQMALPAQMAARVERRDAADSRLRKWRGRCSRVR